VQVSLAAEGARTNWRGCRMHLCLLRRRTRNWKRNLSRRSRGCKPGSVRSRRRRRLSSRRQPTRGRAKRVGEIQAALEEAAAKASSAQLDKSRVENALGTVSKPIEKSRRELAALQQRLADLEFGAVEYGAVRRSAPGTEFSETEQRLFLMRGGDVRPSRPVWPRPRKRSRRSRALD